MAYRVLLATIILIVSALSPGMRQVNALQAESVTVTLQPSSGQTVSGLVVLTDAGEERTNVQVQIVGAEPGTSTMIHRGTCDSFDSTPVGLLGDPGAAGTIQSTVLVSFATLTDGNHLVAVHPGVTERDTTLACGEIPFSAEPPDPDNPSDPTSTPAPFEPPDPDSPTNTPEPFEPPDPDSPTSTPTDINPVDGQTYTSPTYGYSFSWDDTWSVEMVGTIESADLITLSNVGSRLEFVADEQYGGDLAECLNQSAQALRDITGVGDVEPLVDEAGQPIIGADSESQWAAYSYLSSHDNSETGRRVVYFQCFSLTETAVLSLKQSTFADEYRDEAAARDAVLATLRIPGQPPRPTAEPSPPPTSEPTEAPTEVPTVAPTPTPNACEGIDDWIVVTQPRIDRMLDLILDVNRADIFTVERVLSGARDESASMAREQALESTPAAAADLQQRFVDLLLAEADLAQRQLDLYANNPGNTIVQERISQEAADNLATLMDINGKVSELRVMC